MVMGGGVVMTILVGISALGSLSGHIMTSSRLCFVGARQGHMPDCLSLVSVENYTPQPALIFLVSYYTIMYIRPWFLALIPKFLGDFGVFLWALWPDL